MSVLQVILDHVVNTKRMFVQKANLALHVIRNVIALTKWHVIQMVLVVYVILVTLVNPAIKL